MSRVLAEVGQSAFTPASKSSTQENCQSGDVLVPLEVSLGDDDAAVPQQNDPGRQVDPASSLGGGSGGTKESASDKRETQTENRADSGSTNPTGIVCPPCPVQPLEERPQAPNSYTCTYKDCKFTTQSPKVRHASTGSGPLGAAPQILCMFSNSRLSGLSAQVLEHHIMTHQVLESY